jgi:DNA-directed RNA polymerase specialized sigma subunit
MLNEISRNQEQRVLELFFCSDDRRLKVIGQIVGTSDQTVSRIIQDFYDKKIQFDRGNFLYFHSSINNF